MISDIVFISYHEPNADENFERLLEVVPHGGISRVRNVEGILNAHEAAAKKAGTPWFYVVDGDNWVLDFKFDYEPKDSIESTYVWRCRNASNGLVYGYGGIKMFHRRTLIDRLKEFKLESDMTTSLFKNFYPMEEIASETRFATSPFDAWKGAFRECAKLASRSIARQKDDETEKRLQTWLSHAEGPHKDYVLKGANDGVEYVANGGDLKNINNFDWLRSTFHQNS